MRIWAAALICGVFLAASARADSTPAQTADPAATALTTCLDAAQDEPQLQSCKGAISGPCMDTPGGESTHGMVMCLNGEYEVWDDLLETYDGQMLERSPELAQQLTQAREAFVAWREVECYRRGAVFGEGSGRGVAIVGCYADITADLTIARILESRDY